MVVKIVILGILVLGDAIILSHAQLGSIPIPMVILFVHRVKPAIIIF